MTDQEELEAAQARINRRRRENPPVFDAMPKASDWLGGMMAKIDAERAADPEAFAAREAECAEREALERAEEKRLATLARRRASLARAGLDPETCDALASAISVPPTVAGHAGSERAAQAVVQFVGDRALRTLLLWGPTGHGKTWAAQWALTQPGAGLVSGSEIKPCAAWDESRERGLSADLLVFDELGGEQSSEWFSTEAARLIETRQTRGLPTIITANMPPTIKGLSPPGVAFWRGKTMTERYGARLVDRLQDVRHGLVVRIQGAQSIRAMRQR